jgi:transglutaminase-like putative cysteine protease
MQKYLQSTPIINFNHPQVNALSKQLAGDFKHDIEIAKACFEYVLNDITHSGDNQSLTPTCSASEVLEYKTGWCYAKSHLLAALLRANNIPTAFCYQRLFCDEYKKETYCLHGLNAIYLKEFGWIKVDARGNKEGINAKFNPPNEYLAFEPIEGEENLFELLSEPLDVVVSALSQDYETMINNFPDIPACS